MTAAFCGPTTPIENSRPTTVLLRAAARLDKPAQPSQAAWSSSAPVTVLETQAWETSCWPSVWSSALKNDQDKRLFLLDAMALIYRAHFALIKSPRFTSGGR